MKIAAWMVVRSYDGIEEYYIDMALKSIVDHVVGVYIQNQGCEDNTIEVAKEVLGDKVPLCVDYLPTGLERFDPAYNEPEYRSKCVMRCEELFKPEWLLKIDADDMYTPFFFNRIQEEEESGRLSFFNSVRHSSERFITPEWRSQSSHAKTMYEGRAYYDPHSHLWRTGLGIQYIKNPGMGGSFFHCVLNKAPDPTFWLPGICNIHLHRSFGPKAFPFWKEGGDEFEETIPFNPEVQAPKWFQSQMNMGEAIRTTSAEFTWPSFVMDKWNAWGVYK